MEMVSPLLSTLPMTLSNLLRSVGADILSCVGYVDPESDGSLEEDLAARRYRALLPDDDEYDSDDY